MSNQFSPHEARAPVQDPDAPFPLMKLPIELRFEVYRKLLVSNRDVCMVAPPPESEYYFYDFGYYSTRPNRLNPAILQTCPQVYHEAIAVLYGENKFRIQQTDKDNRNISLVKRARACIARGVRSDWKQHLLVLIQFLRDHPDLTHLCLDFGGRAVEAKKVQIPIETTLRGHNGLTNLEVSVQKPLSKEGIDFCWRLYFIVIRQNRAAARPEKTELYDSKTCPSFVKVREPVTSARSEVRTEAESWLDDEAVARLLGEK
ncbi:hypothetical protein V8E54_008325 [Elaphomyces granulatus]|jgi:hypothetical protein